MFYIDNLSNIHITRGDTGTILLGLSKGPDTNSCDYIFTKLDEVHLRIYNINEISPLYDIKLDETDIVQIGEESGRFIKIPIEREVSSLIFNKYQYDIKLFTVQPDLSIKVDTVVPRAMMYIEE